MLNIGRLTRTSTLLALLGVSQAFAATDAPANSSPQEIIAASCSGCHSKDGDGRWFRISDQRKTPEGWQMTLVRMQLVHKAQFVDPAGGDAREALGTLVKYFSDTQGLAPQESDPYRFILEQELNTIEQHDSEQFRSMCARCHTGARVALQRRTEDEWRNLVHFHLGQFPTTEYQMMGRDRDWLGQALNEVLPDLAEKYPMQTQDWTQWQAASKPSLEGRWRVVGNMPGRGEFSGEMVTGAKDVDQYTVEFSGQFADGETLSGSGSATVYTGYEWRATLKLGDVSYRQVLAASADGGELTGRTFQRDHNEWGLRMQAVRDVGQSAVLAVQPAYLQAGSEGQLAIIGANLSGDLELGPGLTVVEELSRDKGQIVVRVAADARAPVGARDILVGKSALPGAVTVFERVDRLAVEPAYAVGRVGGNGGSQPVVQAVFDAVAFSDGPDGEPDTADDLRIGRMPAQWSVSPWNEQAAMDQDVKFAGQMDKDGGVFTPAAAGPNPERKYQTNNAGNLKVSASIVQDGQTVQGDGHLMVTVQRWNNPPIR
ncbi:MAG: quinohemoprotein amine dehydrogenase subunit alpha [Halieaceae bacterium]|nr:quinohemoprotein amine dehydrogenase subunit alpha [Halieaceae bacterium]